MSDSEQLADLLIRWHELNQQGAEPAIEELCADCPQLIDQLRRRIQVTRQHQRLFLTDASLAFRSSADGQANPTFLGDVHLQDVIYDGDAKVNSE